MPRNTTLDSIIATGILGQQYRVLSVALDWPTGDPPYADGSYVTVPAVPTTPPVYDAAEFDPDAWTDITALVSDYHYTQDATMQAGQLSLAVPAAWRSSLAPVFKEMRALVVQERFRSGIHDTGWLNRCWCLSDGPNTTWDASRHGYIVNAKDVLKLANIDIIGARTGNLVLEADVIRAGSFAEKADLVLVNTAADAYEYALTSDGTDEGAIHPNWADRPAPQFWVTNARDKDGNLVAEPVAITGSGIQAVFGEGLLRVGKAYASTSSASGGATDFSAGLGIPAGTAPTVVGIVHRFAHPADPRTTPELPADVVDGLTVESSAAGEVTLSGNVYSAGLTLILRDGSGRRYQTIASETTTDTLTLTRSDVTIAPGTAVSYGDANRLRDVLTRLLLQCGYQMADDGEPLYLHDPETPVIAGEAHDLILPPQVYLDTDNLRHIGAVARLREGGYIPPNYYVYADSNGQVYARSILQLAAGHASTIPVSAITSSPGLAYERSDIATYTRVIARGLVRQVEELTQRTGVTVEDVAEEDGGIPDASTYLFHDYAPVGWAARGELVGYSYEFPLANLIDRGRPASVLLTDLCPWAWYIQFPKSWGYDITQVASDWTDGVLCEITLPEPLAVEAIDLHVANTWNVSWGWGQSNRRGSNAGHQILGVDYYDTEQAAWKPLASNIHCSIDETLKRITSDAFDCRASVEADRYRVVCRRPFWGWNMTADESYDHFVVCVWLSQIALWGAKELRGIAELGSADNYGAELSSAGWQTIRDRLRSRTYILPDAVPWVDSQTYADWLAIEWLKEHCKDLAPRRLAAIRPDVRLWDTIAFTDPLGNAASYLVINTDHSSDPRCATAIQATNYLAPYIED